MFFAPILLQATPGPDITVVGNKLKKLQLSLETDKGTLKSCTIEVSSGDAFIDREACESARTCIKHGVAYTHPLMNCIDREIMAAVGRQNNGKESDDAQHQ